MLSAVLETPDFCGAAVKAAALATREARMESFILSCFKICIRNEETILVRTGLEQHDTAAPTARLQRKAKTKIQPSLSFHGASSYSNHTNKA
mmetsp:Transcript_33551/g.95489  ORF Transcript_33551/g.95489 Transcript_33551/m.95489 type:complete len:92 (-) Transcript_33551:26-301(-)